MSRTYRKLTKANTRWTFGISSPKGDSKPYTNRFTSNDGKQGYRCNCDWCVEGKHHKHRKKMTPIHWELDAVE